MLNKVVLMGRLTSDPELRHTPNSTAVTSFTLAVNRTFSRGNEQTDFVDIVAWGNTAEFVSKWFTKGLLVAVSGRIQTRTWKISREISVNRLRLSQKKFILRNPNEAMLLHVQMQVTALRRQVTICLWAILILTCLPMMTASCHSDINKRRMNNGKRF